MSCLLEVGAFAFYCAVSLNGTNANLCGAINCATGMRLEEGGA